MWTWSETPETGFIVTRLIYDPSDGQSTAKTYTTKDTFWYSTVLDCPKIPVEETLVILQEDVGATVKALSMRKSAGVDEIVKVGDAAIDNLEDRRKTTRMGYISGYHSTPPPPKKK